MDAAPEWRVIEADEDETARPVPANVETGDHVPRWLIGAIVAVLAVVCALAIWMTLPTGGVAIDATNAPLDARAVTSASHDPRQTLAAAAIRGTVIVDVEGAVAQPGLHEIADDGRVGDAISAAGGYAQNVDIDAASRALNLAAKVTDGQQIHVPTLGESITAPTTQSGDGSVPGSPAAGGLVDLNHASADELDTLPGIGPVTAAKIIDARAQMPFATVDELQSRGVVGPSTFENLRDLVTVTP